MNNIIKTGGKNVVGLINTKNGALVIPKPFEQEIFLFDTHVAGTSFIEGIEELSQQMNIDDKLDFFREPDNKYDNNAVLIKTTNGVKIGFVPKADNVVFSRLMDEIGRAHV